jgi:hypothetical protein
MDIMEQRL